VAEERPPTVALGPGREFDLIRGFLGRQAGPAPGVLVGPGDDAAVLEGGWVVSQDQAVEGIHFRRPWLSDEEVGYRAAAAALAELAAMAARPVAALVSVAAPRDGDVDLGGLQAGVSRAVRRVGGVVVGGDLSSSPGPLYLDICVLGRTERPVLRSGARVGDELWVSGTLGDAAGAVEVWRAGHRPPPALRARYATPEPRIGAALALSEAGGVTAMLDLSDGLAGDAGHLAAASGVRIVLVPSALPIGPELTRLLGAARARSAALHGGEDFELCFTARPGAVHERLLRAEGHDVPLTRVGRVEPGEGVWLEQAAGGVEPVQRGGWDHWGDG